MSGTVEYRERKVRSKVTRKGQITIPARFRRENSIREGSSVEITDTGRKLIIEPIPDLLSQIGADKGKYDPKILKKMLGESRKRWR
ncbi:MAG: AbrB/MazE/SpoVT family DNA-binding domain-containing protein [Nitrososphaerota archaeon]|nr:AbrB/MazE/SpoVT family DNA-binding domain-containing protein [Nitrososphaerota archaeon]